MAARETGALKEAKDKPEKSVEELTWLLQLEKSLRTNLEESKAQEIAKLQNSLREMLKKVDETNAMLIKERENAKKAIEEAPPVVKETQVIVEDPQKIESLTVEVEGLKTSLESEKQKADDFERKYNEAQACSGERSKKLEDTEEKVRQLQESLTRLEEKITNLESENQRADSGHIGVEAKTTLDNNDILAYWLSNASTLLLLLQRTLKASGAAGVAPQRRCSSSGTLFGRMTQSFRGTPAEVNLSLINGSMSGGVDSLRQVEAKYPAFLFKLQLPAYVEKIYGMIRDKLKKKISPLLGLCIQGSSRSVANTEAQKDLIAHWQVPPFLVRKVFTQIFSFINVQLFNSLLLRRECCSFSNGEYVKAGLAELEDWSYKATDEYAGSAWDELKHIGQAIGFLVIHKKPKKTLDEISHDLFPVLSIQQLYRISTLYWDDKYGTRSVSPDVISNMIVLMTEDSNNAVSSSFLLDDGSRWGLLSLPAPLEQISFSRFGLEAWEIWVAQGGNGLIRVLKGLDEWGSVWSKAERDSRDGGLAWGMREGTHVGANTFEEANFELGGGDLVWRVGWDKVGVNGWD
ncbi:Myosin-11 protein [Spatholobus suberectus]|nr:Myosin-11 protein [Spatholobus suberectus]